MLGPQAAAQYKTDNFSSILNDSVLQQALVVKQKNSKQWRYLIDAALAFTIGMLTRQLPIRARPGRTWLPTDWKAYFRIAMGIFAANRLNKALGWQPPPWLGAIEAVTIINPLALGISFKSLAQYIVMAPLVAGMVQLANTLNEKVARPLQAKFDVPPLVTRLAFSVLFGGIGILVYPKIFKAIAKMGLFGKTIRHEAAQGLSAIAGSSLVTCARGCSPGSIICLSETAELLGGLGNWCKSRFNNRTE